MTMEEAIKILKAIRAYECYPKSASEETKEAIDMAIEALSAEAESKEEHVKALNDLAVAWKNKLDEESYERGYTAGQFADRPKGEWIPHTTSVGLKHYAEYARCSECGEMALVHMNFCPNCGAKMDKGGDTE